MPKGVPTATVAVDNATNAGLLAARILGIANHNLLSRLAPPPLFLFVDVRVC